MRGGIIIKNKFRLKQNLIHYLPHYAIAVTALIVAVVLDMFSPQISMHLVDDVILAKDTSMLNILLLGMAGIGIGRCLLTYLKEFTFDFVSVHIAKNLRRDLFTHVLKLDTEYFDNNNTGEIMARVKDDIDRIWDALCYVSMLLIEVFIHTAVILVFMVKLNPILTILPVLAMSFCAYMAVMLEKKLDKIYDEISDANADLNTTAEENIGGVRTVRAFVREKFEIEKFTKHNKHYCDASILETKTFIKYYPYFQFISRVLPLLTILAGAVFYIRGAMTLGQLTAYVSYTQNIVWPMEMLGWLTNSFSSAIASYKKVKKIYDEVSTITDSCNSKDPQNIQGHITFKNVSFHKEDMHDILKNISFDLPSGKTLGIMGATGSGKTSIISLLERLYDSTEGEILLDGVNIKDMSLSKLRGSIALVMQDVYLFSETIIENIKMGERKSTSKEIVKRASIDACASEFIEKMEEEYETVIGERGVGLSGGQKQRISIARAFSKERPILIMDDSTSALDAETEQKIQTTLSGLTNKTKIIIGHRISAVRNSDLIIVLDEGSIKEAGTHEELLRLKGLYYETYVSQYGEPIELRKEA